MKLRQLTPALSVAAQPFMSDFEILKKEFGFHGVISNRPDGEDEAQPYASDVANILKKHGVEFRHIPVLPGKIVEGHIMAFSEAISEMRGPVLAFCKSGTRSAFLWALASAPRLDPFVIQDVVTKAGYDVGPLMKKLEARWLE